MARAKKTASVTSTAPKTRGIDVQEVEARVTALDKAKRRSYDIFDIEQRVYNLEKNGGGGSANLTTLNATPTTSSQTITPENPYDGFDEVNIAAVTCAIDANITAGNIKKDVTILGVTGTLEAGSSSTEIISRENGDPLSGSHTITKTGTYAIWTVLANSFTSDYSFKVNGESATLNVVSTADISQGIGYTYGTISLSAGDVFSWNVSNNNRYFVMFSE